MKRICAFILTLAGLAFAASAARAQSAAGDVVGAVLDASGAPLPGVTILATNKATGAKRLDTSGADGAFALRSLPVGDYTVLAELEGFSPVTVDDVHVSVASSRTLEVTLALSTVQESITVVDEAPLVDTTPSIGTTVSQKELESLPLNGRQFANVAVLAPGTSLSYNSDPTKPGQLTVALNGGSGRNLNFLIDGGDNTDDTIGGALQNFNLDAVQEFKVQTAQYKAEFGRSSGGVLSVVTKTGSNQLQASAYEFARREEWNERTETEKLAQADKAPYKRDQYGGTLGGPIVRDRARFFATYEKLERANSYTIDTTSPDTGQPIYPDSQGAAVAIPFTDELITAKASVDLAENQLLAVRYGYQKNSDLSYGASAQTLPSALGSVNNEYESYLASHTWQIGSDKLNEAVFQYTTFANGIVPSSTEPFLLYPGGVTVGQNVNTPQTTDQEKYQYKDDFSFSRELGGDRHDFKAGASWMHEPTLGGSFTTGTAGQFTLLDDRVGSPVTDIVFNGGFAGFSTPVEQYSVYFQDDWAVTPRLTLNLGVRYDLNTGFDLDQSSSAVWQTLSTQTTFHEDYLLDFQRDNGRVLDEDRDNVSPRIGFSWDMQGDGRHLLHGGLGRFYDFPYTNATILFPAIAVQSNFGQVYNLHSDTGILNPDGSFFQPGDPLPPEGVISDLGPASLDVASPTLATPYSDQISLGYSWQVNDWLGLTADAISARYRDIPFRFRANPSLDANGNPQAGRRFPAFGNFRIWYGKGEADYQAVNLGFRIRREKFEMQGFYTYSEAEGNVLAGADEFRIWNTTYQADILNTDAPINTLDPLCDACTGPLDTDSRHRVTFAATYTMPWNILLSGFYRYKSATPYTKFAGTDLNGDIFRQDLAPGVSEVNSERGDSFSQLDIRLSKDFLIGDFGIEVIAEMFNVFNEKNPALFDSAGVAHAYAGDPLQGEQRSAQFGLRLHWR